MKEETTITEKRHIVYEPFDYLVENTKGKNIRGKLIDAFNIWLKVPESEIVIIKEIISKLHNASLLIDDIEDNSHLRRGVPCAHLIYGTASTINSANFMYFEAMQECLKLPSAYAHSALELFLVELKRLHEGQALDIYWRDASLCPTEAEYMSMVRDKTGGLFRLAIGLMQCCSTVTFDFTDIVNTMADYFQILDDYLNLKATKYHVNKSYCEDITEGKFSFPIIHAIQVSHSRHDSRVLNILKKKTEDVELKKYCVSLMSSFGSFDYTKSFLESLHVKLQSLVLNDSLDENKPFLLIVKALSSQMDDSHLSSSSSVDFSKV